MDTKNTSLRLNIALAAFFLCVLAYVTIRYAAELTALVSDPHRFREHLLTFGPWSAVVFMFFQMLQVVIAIIPGEPVQIAGGYLFGTFWGTLYSLVGITIGYVIVFFAVRLIGFPLVQRLVSAEHLQKFETVLNNPKLEATLFVLFLLPGVPKDVLVYVSGLTPIKPMLFFTIISVARLPAMIGSSYIGAKIESNEYVIAIVVSIIASVLFVAGYIWRDKILSFFQSRLRRHRDQ